MGWQVPGSSKAGDEPASLPGLGSCLLQWAPLPSSLLLAMVPTVTAALPAPAGQGLGPTTPTCEIERSRLVGAGLGSCVAG